MPQRRKDSILEQAPATSKFQRFCNLILAQLRLLNFDRAAKLLPSERLALKLRESPRALQLKASQVIFLLPLVRKSQVSNWALVESNLAKTASSFIAQTNENWKAIICGQDRPNIPDDPRIHFLQFTNEIEGNDKWAKLAELVQYFPTVSRPSGYVMTFDADDLAHHDLVETFLSLQHQNGYLIDHGLIHDIDAQTYGQSGHPTLTKPLRKPFWKLCGSCAAFRYDPYEFTRLRDFIKAATQHEHRMFPYLAKLASRPLAPLNNNMVIYEFNHGQNFGLRRERGSFKSRFAQRYKITDAKTLEQIKQDFN